MSFYQQLIIKSTNCTETDARKIEEYMRHVIFHSTLDWQTKEQFEHGARKAWLCIQYLRTRGDII